MVVCFLFDLFVTFSTLGTGALLGQMTLGKVELYGQVETRTSQRRNLLDVLIQRGVAPVTLLSND